jgi:hypothetical protein
MEIDRHQIFREYLAEADRHIRDAEMIMERQRLVIAKLKASGEEATEAEATLDMSVRALDLFKRRRQSVIDQGQAIVT